MTLTRSIFAVAGAALALPHLSPHFLTAAFSTPLQSLDSTIVRGMVADSITTSSDESIESLDGRTDAVATSRYIVQNRFRVKAGREAAFEKRWADSKSRVGNLPGFRFFCMMRLVNDNKGGRDGDDDDNERPNYVSSTVWETYDNFEAWKKGDAFKESHGGGTIKGVASMLLATARNTKGGKPKPAYWEGLLPTSIEGTPPADGAGFRTVETDGTTTLPTDCFIAMNRFSVRPGMGGAFEARFASRESTLKDYDGFKGFLMLRRDGNKKPNDGDEPDDGCTHSTFSVWKDRGAFEAWRSDSAAKPKPKAEGSGGPPNIYASPPVPSFYEGILALESTPGI